MLFSGAILKSDLQESEVYTPHVALFVCDIIILHLIAPLGLCENMPKLNENTIDRLAWLGAFFFPAP